MTDLQAHRLRNIRKKAENDPNGELSLLLRLYDEAENRATVARIDAINECVDLMLARVIKDRGPTSIEDYVVPTAQAEAQACVDELKAYADNELKYIRTLVE